MYDVNFFPTDGMTIIKMECSLPKPITEYKTILDPQAGKGDILNHIKKNNKYHEFNFYAVEINDECYKILNQEKYPVIGRDFLELQTDLLFDLIIMNPPFDKGAEHLLKAWEIAQNTDIVCLLNAETIRNPCTANRQLLAKIIEDNNGKVRDLGRCFAHAERQTNVEVVMVTLSKKVEQEKFVFDFENQELETDNIKFDELATTCTGIQKADPLGAILDQYEQAKDAFLDYMKAKEKVEYYAQNIINGNTSVSSMCINACEKETREEQYNYFNTHLKQQVWSHILSFLKLDRFMTSRLYNEFNQFKQENGNLALTRENILSVFQMIVGNCDNILEKCIVDVFELFVKYHEKNRVYPKGWKTNDPFKVNKKIIIPNGVKYGEYMSASNLREYGDTFNTNYNTDREYRDIDKAMCYITGRRYPDVKVDEEEEKRNPAITTIEQALDAQFKRLGNVRSGSFDNQCESTFFDIKFHKSGTLHLVFKDKDLCAEFNQRACAGRNWIGGEL